MLLRYTIFVIAIIFAAVYRPAAFAQSRPDVIRQTTSDDTADPGYKVTHFTAAEGLPSSNVYSVAEDSLGYLWIGTLGGLTRYDGYSFEPYLPITGDSSSISTSAIFGLMSDPEGKIWIGSRYDDPRGLNRFDPVSERFTRFFQESDQEAKLTAYPLFVSNDDEDVLWVATFDQEKGKSSLHRFSPNKGEALSSYELKSIDATTVGVVLGGFQENDGMIWLGTRGWGGVSKMGLYQISPSMDSLEYFGPEKIVNGTESGFDVYSMVRDDGDTLWIGSSYGLFKFDLRTEAFIALYSINSDNVEDPANQVTQVFKDRSGALWVGGAQGIYLFDEVNELFSLIYGGPSGHVWDIHEDRFGTIWIATSEGLLKLSQFENPFEIFSRTSMGTFPTSSFANKRFYFYETRKGDVWRLSEQGVITINKKGGEEVTRLIESGANWFYEDQAGDIWISKCVDGLARYIDGNPEKRIIYQHDPQNPNSIGTCVNPVIEDRAGNLWISLYGDGIDRFDRETGVFEHYRKATHGIGSQSVYNLIESTIEPGIIWMSTTDGIVKFDVEVSSFTNYFSENLRRTVMIYEDGEGRLWAATAGNGLQLFDRESGEVIKTYKVEDGLSHNTIWAVYGDKNGNLWMSTNNGISRFDPTTGQFRSFSTSHGLPNVEFTELGKSQTPDGKLYFSTGQYGVSFHPENIADNLIASEVFLTGLEVNGIDQKPEENGPLEISIRLAESITLSHRQNDLTLEYVGIHPNDPHLQRYRYELEGYDDEWIEAGAQRVARYSKLPFGKYTFKVMATNRDGIWSERGASLRITILPPWWRTTAAYIVYGLFLLTGIVAVDRYQRRRLLRKAREKARERELAHAEEIRQAHDELKQTHEHLKTTQQQLVQQEKLASLGQLTAGIAHEIKNPLNFVNNFAAINDDLAGELDDVLTRSEDKPVKEIRPEINDLLGSFKTNSRQIAKHGRRADRIVQGMMQHASSSAGERYEVAVNPMVQEHVNLAYHSFKSRRPDVDIVIEQELAEDVGSVKVAPQDIGRVLQNILGNAFDAVHEKATQSNNDYIPRVRIKTAHTEHAVEIKIEDNGIGIPHNVMDRVFEPFFTTKPAGSGTGLGLSLSYDIVTQGHGGALTVESMEGEGATFVVTLPL